MEPLCLRVNLGQRSYDIVVTHGDLRGLGSFARQRLQGTRALIVTDEHVTAHARKVEQALVEAGWRTTMFVGAAGEEQKSLKSAAALYDVLVDLPADRRTLIVAVGGGVVGDLAGFVASTFARGLPLLMVPTTLLAMVDSSVGGKTAVNHARAKNMIGTFHQPAGVWIDVATLETLPERDFRSGLAEVVKYGVILDPAFFAYLEGHVDEILERRPAVIQQIVARCCRLKADVVEKDEREETGVRAVLNYGHTFAHAFETAGKYGDWLHGEAVAAGMICASRLAEIRGLISSDLTQRQLKLLRAFGLPTVPKAWPVAELLATMRTDKKALAGKMRFILPQKMGEVALFDDIPEAEVEEAILGLTNKTI
jgi:3-dehydroquinate synthase